MLFIIHYFYFFFFIHCTITYFFFFFNDTATTEIYTLSLHDALPIFVESSQGGQQTIQGTVQRVRIEARSCWFGLGRFLKNCLWCLWGRNGICRAFRNRGRWSGRIGPGQKRKRGFRDRKSVV